MKFVFVVLLLLPGCLIAKEPREDSSPDRMVSAFLSETKDRKTGDTGTKVTIEDLNGKTLFEDSTTLAHYVVDDSIWTEDGKYLLLVTINADGHSPWHHPLFILNISARKIRRMDDFEGHPFISSQVWTRAPDTVILVAHTFRHGLTAPDDPVIVRFRVSEVWARLKSN